MEIRFDIADLFLFFYFLGVKFMYEVQIFVVFFWSVLWKKANTKAIERFNCNGFVS